jgi:hypothetical protein
MKTYFDTAVRENRYYSQKTGLSAKTGVIWVVKVWVDKRVLLKHTGTYVFDLRLRTSSTRICMPWPVANGICSTCEYHSVLQQMLLWWQKPLRRAKNPTRKPKPNQR